MSENQNRFEKALMSIVAAVALIILWIISGNPPRPEKPKVSQPILFSEHWVALGDPGTRRHLDSDAQVIVIIKDDIPFIFPEGDVAEGEVINLGDHFITFSTLNGLLLFKNESPDKLVLIKMNSGDKTVFQNTKSPLQEWDPETGKALIAALDDLKPVPARFERWGDIAEEMIEKNGRMFFSDREQLKREKLLSGRE